MESKWPDVTLHMRGIILHLCNLRMLEDTFSCGAVHMKDKRVEKTSRNPASIFYKSTADRYRPVSYPDGPITDRYRFK